MNILQIIKHKLNSPTSIAPLVVYRVLFGAMMVFSIIRFALKGWIYDLYVKPSFFFPYYGFEWISPLGSTGIYLVFLLMGIAALFISIGFFYRISAILFFVFFTYIELLDKTNYLNHYYFVSLMSFLLTLLPANRKFSVDSWRNPNFKADTVPFWTIGIIQFQVGLVYVMAGIAKLNYDWLINAMPLKIWLPARADVPVIGWLFDYPLTAYLFSWGGAFFDLFIVFFMLIKRARPWAYATIILFHTLTYLLFNIGVFPLVMTLSALIFFSSAFHQHIINRFMRFFGIMSAQKVADSSHFSYSKIMSKGLTFFLLIYMIINILIPFRYLLYPGNLFWTEQGYRFSWRVMLMEKAGVAIFYVRDSVTGKSIEVTNSDFLTPNQEKMMGTQPDMILQYAYFLKQEFEKKGIRKPKVTTECYVTLNGRGSRQFIDPNVDLTTVQSDFSHKYWILQF